MKINDNYNNLTESYLFSTISKKIAEFKEKNPNADIIKMGIGDVTLPLAKTVVDAMTKASMEMGKKESFRGYGPEQGYDFLRASIKEYYGKKNVSLKDDEIFVSDGAKSDLGNILDIFSIDNKVLIPDPVYPVYLDTNIMAGREVAFMKAGEENNFLPMPDESVAADIIYLCSPNNPTGSVYTYEMLAKWVQYAINQNAVILFDAAYECFIKDKSLPTSIYLIPGAEKCAIEFSSFSKMAGFTGTRCGYTVIPMALEFEGVKLNKLWLRRQTTKFNGVPYIIQRGAEAALCDEGFAQCRNNIEYYMKNAEIMAETFRKKGIYFTGGENSPYIWLKCPDNMTSWEFFDYLLEKANLVGTPGSGFGENGEGFFRLTAFGDRDNTIEAMKRIEKLL
ncbi:LL-diaminopimelate aminotransferase [Anaeropeptidivorans aminofermentans]|uniref:LL-diaminopimelate aminotransferase n=1 Tax=Anaeropeptidivorans aminofermentans TaxID=2934315 RepID=UPI0020243D04|nr:LL-diaminopimelate aminotransferase [Anaeropeptidivorans aminofermentans]